MRFPVLTVVAIGLATAATAADPEKPPAIALGGLDPVELVAGKEVKGKADGAVKHGRFRYAFASDANRTTFLKDPARYAAQFDGACMKMGPLSGGGDPDRYHVFAGRIYLFASDSCRNGFKANPTAFIDHEDAAPEGKPEAVKQAKTLLAKAADGLGGGKALNDLSTYQVRYRIAVKRGDRETKYTRTDTASFPLRFSQTDDYGNYKGGWLLLPDEGYLSWEKTPVDPSVRAHMVLEFYRHPIHLLKAWQAGDATAVHLGAGTVGDTAVERVAVGVKGATSTLSIDPKSGHVLRIAFRGRTAVGITDVEKDYSDFKPENGLTVPHAVSTRIDGQPAANTTVTVEAIRVNERIDQAVFEKPREK